MFYDYIVKNLKAAEFSEFALYKGDIWKNVISLGGAEFSLQSLGGIPPVSEALLPVWPHIQA
jgi:hypothetical protein